VRCAPIHVSILPLPTERILPPPLVTGAAEGLACRDNSAIAHVISLLRSNADGPPRCARAWLDGLRSHGHHQKPACRETEGRLTSAPIRLQYLPDTGEGTDTWLPRT
jgi:hypothetical protein